MKVGFTGTRDGATDPQMACVRLVCRILDMTEAHEGDCVGFDAQAWSMANDMIPSDRVHIHPPEKSDLRAHAWIAGNVEHPPKNYFARNRDIVDATDVTVGAPPANHELSEGGTWYTLDYARKKGKPVIVCWPDGEYSIANVIEAAQSRIKIPVMEGMRKAGIARKPLLGKWERDSE